MPEPWWRKSLCAQVDREEFFPKLGDNGNDACALCRKCDVRVMCLAEAIAADKEIPYGIWGGFGRDVRRNLRRRVARGKAPLLVAAQAVAVDRHRRG